jgi:hypothetical protein
MKYIFCLLGIWGLYLGFTTHGVVSYIDCFLGGALIGFSLLKIKL